MLLESLVFYALFKTAYAHVRPSVVFQARSDKPMQIFLWN